MNSCLAREFPGGPNGTMPVGTGSDCTTNEAGIMKLLPLIAASATIVLGGAGIAAAQGQSGPMASPSAAPNPAIKSPHNMTGAPLAKGHNSFTRGEAKARIEKAGFGHVRDLMLDSDGLWQADAMRDGQPVKVAMDYKGDVVTQ